MISEPTPAMKQQRSFALALLISEMHVIEPPGRIDAGKFRGRLLLPIEPPEVDSLLFKRMMQKVHVVCCVVFVSDVEGHVFLCRGIDAHRTGHRGISRFPWLHAGRRMHVEAGL